MGNLRVVFNKIINLIFIAFIVSFYSSAFSQTIEWKIDGRFRLITSEDSESENQLYTFAKAAKNINCAVDQRACEPNQTQENVKNELSNIAHKGNVGFLHNIPKTNYDSTTFRYKNDYIKEPKEWKIILSSDLSDKSGCEWFINEIKDNGQGDENSCTDFRPKISVKNGDVITLKVNSTNETQKVTIEATDLLVVGIGDSYASGEGMPDVPGNNPKWLDKNCHRSLLSVQSLTAARLAEINPHRSVTFVTRSCSGAKINDLTINMQDKDEDPEPQLKAIKADLCLEKLNLKKECSGKIRQPDLILLSIGGNDGYFVPMMRDSILKESVKKKSIDLKNAKRRDDGLVNIWRDFPSLVNSIFGCEDGFDHAVVIHVGYPDPLTQGGVETEVCHKDGEQPTDGVVIGKAMRYLGMNIKTSEYKALRDDFVMPLTGSVKESPVGVEDYQYGLRQVDIAIACIINNKELKQLSFPIKIDGDDLKNIANKPECENYWGKVGFTDFTKFSGARWRFTLARNEIFSKQPNQLNTIYRPEGFVTNGICLKNTNVDGRWLNTSGDSNDYAGNISGLLHPNIYGQLYLANRAWLAIPEEMRK